MSIFNNNLKTIYPDIMRVALKLSRYDRENAEDLVQKALLKALEKQNLFKGGNLAGWVVTIMKNIFLDEYRKTKGKEFVDISGEKLSHRDIEYLVKGDGEFRELGDNESAIDAKKRVEGVMEALNKIGSKCKTILLLIGQEYKYKEISERMDVPMGTVMNSLLRCRKKLHQELYGSSQYNEI
jgi:RNA polymerase sigma-70 factor (ECF subfamily)